MQVQVNLLGNLREERVQIIALPDGSNTKDLIHQLKIPSEEVGVLSVNGRMATFEQRLEEGDIIHIVPPIGGG